MDFKNLLEADENVKFPFLYNIYSTQILKNYKGVSPCFFNFFKPKFEKMLRGLTTLLTFIL